MLVDSLNLTCRYRTCSDVVQNKQLSPYVVYGIEAISECDEAIVYRALKGISADRAQVEHMVNLFNQYRLPPIHLEDVVEDMNA